MKLVFFDDFKLGVIKDSQVVDVRAAVSGITHSSPQDLINKIIAVKKTTIFFVKFFIYLFPYCYLNNLN